MAVEQLELGAVEAPSPGQRPRRVEGLESPGDEGELREAFELVETPAPVSTSATVTASARAGQGTGR